MIVAPLVIMEEEFMVPYEESEPASFKLIVVEVELGRGWGVRQGGWG